VFSEQTWLARLIWGALVILAMGALAFGRWELSFVAIATLALSLAPILVARWAHINVPPSFVAAIAIFVASTLILGETFDFYERLWWWDIAMHGVSAIGFGLIGFILVFMMFQGDRYLATHFGIAFFAFCFAATIGVLWEVFEFSMDQLFGFNMQKSGLIDTMGDLIVDLIGAGIGAASGFAYLKGKKYGGLTGLIEEFVHRNPHFFKHWRK
jgi:hypothetical protein